MVDLRPAPGGRLPAVCHLVGGSGVPAKEEPLYGAVRALGPLAVHLAAAH